MSVEQVQRPENLDVASAIKRVQAGNQRFANDAMSHKYSLTERRLELVDTQSLCNYRHLLTGWVTGLEG
jgi:hypothetical protein